MTSLFRSFLSRPRALALTTALFAVACADGGRGAASDEAEAQGAAPFVDEDTKRSITIDGFAVELMHAPRLLQDGPLADLGSLANSAVEFAAYTGRLAPENARSLSSQPMRLAQFADRMTEQPTETPDSEITIEHLERKDVFPAIVRSMETGDPWPERGEFQRTLRTVVPSLLAKPTTDIFQVTYCPDWCNEAIIAVTADGEIRMLIAFGDV
jgi:hypothetical protein